MSLRNILSMDYGLCRLCNEMRKCRVLNSEYQHLGQMEVYTDMLMEAFGLVLLNLESLSSERLVCATCVVRLRASCAFKRQVLRCEETLLSKLQETGRKMKVEDGRSSVFNTSVSVKESTEDVHSELDDSNVQCEDTLATAEDSPAGSQTDDVDSYCDLEVLEESLLISDGDDDDIEIKIEPIDSNPSSGQQVQKKPTKPKKPNKPSESTDEDKPLSGMKGVLAYRNQPTEEVMKQRMDRLRALMASTKRRPPNRPAKTAYIHKRPQSRNKEIQAQANTVMIVENSYVTPFNNINGNYYCYYCRSIFTDPAMLREHNLTHDPKPYYLRNWSLRRAPKLDITRIDCRLCDAAVDSIPELKGHLTAVHGKKFHNVTNEFLVFKLTHPEVACMECGEKFFFIDKLIDHMAEHFGKYICDKCGAAFVQYGSLQAHVRCHTKPNVDFPCHVCGKSLTTNRSRRMHVATVHDKQSLIECYECDEKFLNYEKRNRHMVDAHGHVRTIPCPHCDKTFENRKNFLRHLNRKHTARNVEYQCQHCEKTFAVTASLKAHVRVHHKTKVHKR